MPMLRKAARPSRLRYGLAIATALLAFSASAEALDRLPGPPLGGPAAQPIESPGALGAFCLARRASWLDVGAFGLAVLAVPLLAFRRSARQHSQPD